jgi:hypothetical protein
VPHIPSRDQSRLSHAELALAVVVIVSLLLTLFTFLRQSDTVVAAGAFVRTRRESVVRAGRRLGRHHVAIWHGREVIAASGWLRSAVTPPLVQRSAPLLAPKSGYSITRLRQIDRLAAQERWSSERLRLYVRSDLGAAVTQGDEVASIVPAPDTSIRAEDIRAAQKCFAFRRLAGVGQSAEAVAVLVGLVSSLASAGNAGGASALGEHLLGLLGEHLRGVRAGRGSAASDGEIGLMPVLLTFVLQTLRARANAQDETSRRALDAVLERGLRLGSREDGAVPMLTVHLRRTLAGEAEAETRLGLLWHAGAHALRIEDELGRRSIRSAFEDEMTSGEEQVRAIEVAGRWVQLATATRPLRARQLFDWWWQTGNAPANARTVFALRVGGSALLARHYSMAAEVVRRLSDQDFEVWRQYFDNLDTAEREQGSSDFYNYVGGAWHS